jgi:hypothetical protein
LHTPTLLQIATRTFSTNFGTHTMIPLLDLANHDTACPNYRQVRPCPDDKDMQCMYWLAGKDYKKGEAVSDGARLVCICSACFTAGWVSAHVDTCLSGVCLRMGVCMVCMQGEVLYECQS